MNNVPPLEILFLIQRRQNNYQILHHSISGFIMSTVLGKIKLYSLFIFETLVTFGLNGALPPFNSIQQTLSRAISNG